MDKIKHRVYHAKSKAVRDTAEDYFEKLRRALEKADGLDVVFDKHMDDRTGKYIVFTSNIEALNECMSMVSNWFGRVDKNPHVYKVYSDNPEASESFKKFKSDNDTTHLRLLFAIDALNEGVHIDDISGVILFRPTVSPIIYKQQIGRALAVGKNKTPIIFDIVNNFENLYSIGTLQEEMRVAVTYYNYSGESENVVTEGFEIFDEVRECKEIFDELEDTLTASWDLMYLHAKEYYEQNGNLEVPKRFKTKDGYSLGHWIQTQKKVRAGECYGILGDDRIKKLDEIGMIWESRSDFRWSRYYTAAKKYREKFGNLDVNCKYVNEEGVRLGAWICNLRSSFKNGNYSAYLTEDHIRELNELDMIWDQPNFLWERNYAAAMKFYKENGHLEVPYLQSPIGQASLKARETGTTVTGIKQAEFRKIEIIIPNYEIQKKISGILKALDEKIELNNAINNNLEQQAKALYKDWFFDFSPFLTEGNLPDGWHLGTVGDIIQLHDSKRVPLSGSERDKMEKIYPYYGATSLMDYVDNYLVDGIYLLLGEDGTVVDSLGFPILQYVYGQFWVNNHAHIITGKEGFSVEELYLFFSLTNIKSIVTGAVQQKVSQQNLKKVPAIIPSKEALSAFDDLIQPIFAQIRNLRDENAHLADLRDTLLPRLMSGELDVSDIEI